MLPYSSPGGYGGSYGRRKGLLNSPAAVAGGVALLLLAALGFAFYTHFHASAAHAEKSKLQRELESARSELFSLRSQFTSRNHDFEQLQVTHGHAQRRLTEVSSQLQRKEAELVTKDQSLQLHLKERAVADQQLSGREAELAKMVEDLRKELLRSDSVIEALEKKMAAMDNIHGMREKDWHKLAGTWVKYEQDLHEQYKKCTDEVAKLQNQTVTGNDTGPLPEAEPKLRPETDFGKIGVEVPEHQAHHFEPLAPPPAVGQVGSGGAGAAGATDLPLPEPKIRDSIVAMTNGQVGLDPSASPSPAPAQQQQQPQLQQQQEFAAPTPAPVHHQDIYHGDFHDHYQPYDHYHGHYEPYDPMDQYWLRDAHGDWNADNHDDVGQHDQNHHHQEHQDHQQQHDHWHHPSQGTDGGDHNQHHHVPGPMAGMDKPAAAGHDAQHAPSHWHHDQQPPQQQQHHHQYQQQQQQREQHHQQHYQQQQQQYQQQQQQQQQHYQQQQQQHQQHQQQQQQHGHHPQGDLAYKMGW